MREFLDEPVQLPLTFDNHGSPTVHPEHFTSADVVESPAATGPGLHSQFTAAARRHDGASDYDDDHYFEDDHDDQSPAPRRHVPDDILENSHDEHDHATGAQVESGRRDDYQRVARALLRLDRDERRSERDRRGSDRKPDSRLARSHLSPTRTRSVVPRRQSRRHHRSDLRIALSRRGRHRARGGESDLSTGDHRRHRSTDLVDTSSNSLKRVATGPLQGVALALYFVLLPYVVETKWRFSYTVTDGAVLRDLLVGLAIFWFVFLGLLVTYVHQLRHSRHLPSNGCAWLAGLVMMALPFLITSSAEASTAATHAPFTTATTSPARLAESSGVVSAGVRASSVPTPAPEKFGLFALALAAKGRRDRLRATSGSFGDDPPGDPFDDIDLDALAQRLHEGDEPLIARLRDVIGSELDGEALVDDGAFAVATREDFDPVVVALIDSRPEGMTLGYAREGGALPVDLSRSIEDLTASIVALHDGAVRFAQSDNELMRALARRRDASTLVVFLGDPAEIDEELRQLCVTLRAASGTPLFTSAPARRVRVELLRAYPQVQGLVEDFAPTLRRRCVEMVAYLAMHPGEPVTGDRLRTRVLVHANVDASKTTLTNTASSVRRALGARVSIGS